MGKQEDGGDAPYEAAAKALVESLKQKLLGSSQCFKKQEPLIDWCFSLADNQLHADLKTLSTEEVDLGEVLDEHSNTVLKELREALACLTSDGDGGQRKHSWGSFDVCWRQLAKCNSDALNPSDELANAAKMEEREGALTLDLST